jgi:hypothetical protein
MREPLSDEQASAYWSDLGGADAVKAFRAVWRLAACDAGFLLRGRLKPAEPLPSDHVRGLIARLDDPSFARRESAERDLEALGERAGPEFRLALDGDPTFEQYRRLQRLADKLDRPIAHVDRLRELRAIEALEIAGTPASVRLLGELAGGAPDARLTREAAVALARLRAQAVARR